MQVGTGLTEIALEARTTFLCSHTIPAQPPHFRVCPKMAADVDVWFEPCQVWEVEAADVTTSPTYRGASSYLGPDKGLGLRFPRFIRISSRTQPEQATSAGDLVEKYCQEESVSK
eukprot:TRINITY_DN3408_c0_g1_i1.p1 TRINITY_DN3408_c0_g1~~TRINITY_DN3408_c0_g1_i1.p1  ORF type:complete len:115 (+),score=5.84 TRINITY_DN3408_c0_g1_i1:112-456(+)